MAQQTTTNGHSNPSTSPANSTTNPFTLARRLPSGLNITEVELKAARAKLNAQYDAPTTTALARRPTDLGDGCPQCGGAGMLRANSNASPDDRDFGKPTACPDPCHNPDRLRQLALLSNLNEQELSITLDDLEERHNILEFTELDYNRGEDGKPIKLQRSNRVMLQTAREIVADPYDFGIVYILGPNGNGKTTCAQAICNEINRTGKGPAMYINLVELIAFIRAGYDPTNDGPTFDQRYDMISKTPCLIVDEFDFSDGKNAATDHTLGLLQRWFNDRYRLAKIGKGLTILVGNEPIQGLGLPAINSRLADSQFRRTILNTAADERPEVGL